MTLQPPVVPPILQKDVHLDQIQPSRVWTTLSKEQQASVLQALVTMCQECLMPQEEVNHDHYLPLPENHARPS